LATFGEREKFNLVGFLGSTPCVEPCPVVVSVCGIRGRTSWTERRARRATSGVRRARRIRRSTRRWFRRRAVIMPTMQFTPSFTTTTTPIHHLHQVVGLVDFVMVATVGWVAHLAVAIHQRPPREWNRHLVQ
jgi:hypothetical protein